MAEPETSAKANRTHHYFIGLIRPEDSFGLVLILILLDYIAVSTLLPLPWGRVVVNALLGLTLFFSLRTSCSGRIWQVLAGLVFVLSTLAAIASLGGIGSRPLSQAITIVAWLLLLIAPVVILRRISTHRVVTTETLLGAVCVYLLVGFSFAAIYAAIDFFSPTPFFVNAPHATIGEFLFFSYTTLTTVGYGNLVPASHLGQTFAMIEALSGQVYLVIVVARLVSLWGLAARSDQLQQPTAGESDNIAHTESTSLPPGDH